MRNQLLLIFLIFSIPLLAQEKKRKSIVYTYDEKTQIPKSIVFLDPATGNTISTFDIIGNNPFKNLPYPIKGNKNGFPKFDLKGYTLGQLVAPSGSGDLKNNGQKVNSANIHVSLYYRIDENYNNTADYTAVGYSLYFANENEEIIGANSKILIINSFGKVINTIEEANSNCRDIVVTSNGEYITYLYGGVMDHNLEEFLKEGYKIYHVKSGQLLLDSKGIDGYSLLPPLQVGQTIVICLYNYTTGRLYAVYDMENRNVYTKEYSNEEASRIKHIDEDGFLLTLPNRGTKKELYKNNFNVKQL